ncbi:hypothetical protein P243_1900 [Klebsiella pneumoniae subsp. pneumoniae 1158]|nr:hypothetical protein P243_1900 [Klebsiella pneumoniae subsp. pneumoniae 1158]AUB47184.1 hypothetical protein SGH10_001805 [Klebsiella pneumoniae]EHV48012.1 hypothetical protein ECDEC5E_2399 [Escherichia coli DEC5E]EJK88609.1 hypothetical protein UUU_24710 [Klebsiella pneumoniae subsp. pneumoniae DSM 30104 = JCM 1662 = NBRC 14940]AUN67424.1 phosphoribosylanthranilate isomerase [Klebsiella pneumoniae]
MRGNTGQFKKYLLQIYNMRNNGGSGEKAHWHFCITDK